MTEPPEEEEGRRPRQRPRRIDVGSWVGAMMGAGREEPTSEEIEEMEPDTEQEMLFAIGFIARDVSPDERHEARERYKEQYGTDTPYGRDLSRAQWRKWRQLMDYE